GGGGGGGGVGGATQTQSHPPQDSAPAQSRERTPALLCLPGVCCVFTASLPRSAWRARRARQRTAHPRSLFGPVLFSSTLSRYDSIRGRRPCRYVTYCPSNRRTSASTAGPSLRARRPVQPGGTRA